MKRWFDPVYVQSINYVDRLFSCEAPERDCVTDGVVNWIEFTDSMEISRQNMMEHWGVKTGLLGVTRLCREGDSLFFETVVTDLGQVALDAASNGLWWDAHNNEASLTESISRSSEIFEIKHLGVVPRLGLYHRLDLWKKAFPNSPEVQEFETNLTLNMLARICDGDCYTLIGTVDA